MTRSIIFSLSLLTTISITLTLPHYNDDTWMHPYIIHKGVEKRSISTNFDSENKNEENSASFWLEKAQQSVKERLAKKLNENVAKNVILFLGDGMSIPTISAARVYLGGEEQQLSFENFPYTSLSKTYCIDNQVADSACSSTAYSGGVKSNYATIGVTGAVQHGDCAAMLNSSNWVLSIAHYSHLKNKMTGIVTTARVTHASPAGMYAHTANRDWESDADVIKSHNDPIRCQDIASQLVNGTTGRGLNVILGGGRANFLPEINGTGRRQDGRDLIDEWMTSRKDGGAKYVSDRDELLNSNLSNVKYLMGLFDEDHMEYNLKRDKNKTPSLSEMTEAAIEVLKQSPNGFFLFVEGARIDMAHHEAKARLALEETAEFSRAVQRAVDLTQDQDTLIVVTADHAHTMSYSGYASRNGDILGIAGHAKDSIPYTVVNYANGPGYRSPDGNGQRHDVTKDDMSDADYRFPGVSPTVAETHGGDDVAVYARGPWAHLFSGAMEENVLPHLMSFASCVGEGLTVCGEGGVKEKEVEQILIIL